MLYPVVNTCGHFNFRDIIMTDYHIMSLLESIMPPALNCYIVQQAMQNSCIHNSPTLSCLLLLCVFNCRHLQKLHVDLLTPTSRQLLHCVCIQLHVLKGLYNLLTWFGGSVVKFLAHRYLHRCLKAKAC